MHHLTTAETISVLSALGVELPPRTADEVLQKRLKQALKAAQCIPSLIPGGQLDAPSLHAWPAYVDGRANTSVSEAVRRANLTEAAANYSARLSGRTNAIDLYADAFMDLRQTLMVIGRYWDVGRKWFVIMEPRGPGWGRTINVRLLDVYALDDRTPVIVLLYRALSDAQRWTSEEWAKAQADQNGQHEIVTINSTALEQKLLLNVLSLNATYLPADYSPERGPTEDGFQVSLLLPVGPLSFEDVGKLNRDLGCAVCGKKLDNRCARCQSVSYCGKECQRADWSDHKQSCRSIIGGTWRTVPFAAMAPGTEGMCMSVMNRLTTTGHIRASPVSTPSDRAAPPKNVHGSNVFLVKIQVALMTGRPQDMMVYDRQKSVNVFFTAPGAPAYFEELLAEMRGPRGGYDGLKMYRWARRVSDWELSVCVDKEPQTEIKW